MFPTPRRLVLAATLAATSLAPATALACTIFTLRGPGSAWVGNNEDWSYPRSKVWFLPAEPGRHGRVVFGFENGIAQGGMNDRGVFFDWVAGAPTGWTLDPAKPPAPGYLGELVLERAATVDEAVALLREYNEPSFQTGHMVVADRSGDSAVVEWEGGALRVRRIEGRFLAYGFGAAQVRRGLERLEAPSPPALAMVLADALQGGTFATKYSNVYDLRGLRVHWYDFHRHAGPFEFDLAAELAKGPHFYELLALPGQLGRPFGVDQRTLPAVPLAPEVLARFTGCYRGDDGIAFGVTLQDGQLFTETPIDPGRRFERDRRERVRGATWTFTPQGTPAHPEPTARHTFHLERAPDGCGR